mmetsp:Transcript_23487/g.41559  ORF Transcript_23487/g.41559 Transcript_23487/m.41559 type:complete len:269 (-) Transcript_23487:202-1008(-)
MTSPAQPVAAPLVAIIGCLLLHIAAASPAPLPRTRVSSRRLGTRGLAPACAKEPRGLWRKLTSDIRQLANAGHRSTRVGVMLPPTINKPPTIPPPIKKKYGGGRNRSDGVYLLSQISTLQVTQEWKSLPDNEEEFEACLPKIMIWSTGIEYPYPTSWTHSVYPPKFVFGYYKNNVIDSILLARGTTPEYAPWALTFVVDHIAVDPRKNISSALPVLDKIRTLGIRFQVPVDWTSVKNAYNGEIDRLRLSLGEDPSFNYWVMQNSGKHF